MKNKNIAIIGTLDTKGKEFEFLKSIIENQGLETIVIDTGIINPPYFKADISREEVAKKAGTSLDSLISKNDRGYAVNKMAVGVKNIVKEKFEADEIAGIISMGGSAGTTIGSAAMRVLPYGIPKVMISTLSSGNTEPFVGTKDIMMINPVVDISGLNIILKPILINAALSISNMVKNQDIRKEISSEKPLIAATMFGVTTPGVEKAKEYLEKKGYEVLVFHATGTGGRTMEQLIKENYLKGVLDITTTELADELVGGVLSAGKDRLEAAGKKGIPQVISVGALDMVNFGHIDSVPEKFKERNLYKHNENVTLMRTNLQENKELGKILAKKANLAVAPQKVKIYLPLKGVSMIDKKGESFYGPAEDKNLFEQIEKNISSKIDVYKIDKNINDSEFALEMAKKLDQLIKNQ